MLNRTALGLAALQIVAGQAHRCALSADGLVRCWGSNGNRQCGLPAGFVQPTPAVVPGLTDVVEIAATAIHTCARRQDGSVWCWGFNGSGQLGIPDDGTGRAGVTRVDLPAPASRVACGDSMSCAALAGGQLWCWGIWKPDPQEIVPGSPPRYIADGGGIAEIVMAPNRLCVVRASRPDFVSGLGCADSRDPSLAPPPVGVDGIKLFEVMGAVWAQAAISPGNSCAVDAGGRLFCWGDNTFGQVGTGQSGDIWPEPTPVIWHQE